MSDPSSRPSARGRIPPPPPPSDGSSGLGQELRPGELIDGRYRVERTIGQGGVGRVYRALQVRLGRQVAVKVLLEGVLGEDSQRPRFEREAKGLAALSHPHIVSVQDYGVWWGRPFLVMELLEGESLRDRLDRGPLAEEEALRITRDLLRALAYAHEKGVVHRDLKPANIFLQSFPAGLEHVKILDFGFAKFVDNNVLADAPALTVAGTTVCTPAYVAPERLYGGTVDGRSDLYSVAIVLFEMLAGEKPFEGDTSELLRAHLSAPVPKLAERRPGLGQSEALTELLARALQKDPDDRFPDVLAMLRAIETLARPATFTGDGPQAQPAAPQAVAQPVAVAQPGQALSPRRAGLVESLAPLLRQLPTRESLRAAGVGAVRGARLGAAQLRRWIEHGVRWTKPKLQRGTRRLGEQLRRLRQRGQGNGDAGAPRATPVDEAAGDEAPTRVLQRDDRGETSAREPSGRT